MEKTNMPKQIEKSEEEKSNCNCGCLSGKGESENLDKRDLNISQIPRKKA